MKLSLILIFSLFITIDSFGQSDLLCPQSSVPVLSVNSCAPVDYNVATGYGIESPSNVATNTACVPSGNVKSDGWFKFTATAVSTTIIGTITSNRDLALVVYTGTCGSMTEVGCINAGGNNATETLILSTIINTTYYIRLVKNASTSGSLVGTISILTPISNDECSGVISLIPSPPAFPQTCNQTCGHTLNATASSPATVCGGAAGADVWYYFIAAHSSHTITVEGSSLFDADVELFSGGCGSLTSIGCANTTGDGGTENLSYTSFISGQPYFVRVYDFVPAPPTTYEFSICVSSPLSCPTFMGAGVINVGVLPFHGIASTSGNDFTSANTITTGGDNNYLQGMDAVFVFTPNVSGNISVALSSTSSSVGIMLYNGCPFVGSGSTCVAFSQSPLGNQSICTNVIAGITYYLIVDRNVPSGTLSNFNIIITDPVSGNPGATCASAIPISSLPYVINNQTTACKVNDYSNSSLHSCASQYESGEDMVFSYEAPSAKCIRIELFNTSDTHTGFMLYQNCPGSASAICLGYVGGGNVFGNFSLPSAGTYYIIVDSWALPFFANFNLQVVDLNLDDNDACTLDDCNQLSGVTHTQLDTDDNNACTNDGCNTLTGIFHSTIDVDDNNPCTTDACNSIANTWIQKANLGGPGRFLAVSFSIGNNGYIGTGQFSPAQFANDFWEYNSITEAWTQKADFAGGQIRGAVGFSIGHKGYVGTGRYIINGLTNDFWEYNPITNNWIQKSPFPGFPREEAVAFSINNKGYIGTGFAIGGPSKDFWEYNPTTDTWKQKKNFGGSQRSGSVGFSIGLKG